MTDSGQPSPRSAPVWVVSGMSGAGKATALAALARAGVDTVDNLPAPLLDAFVGLPRERVAAVVVDSRHADGLRALDRAPGASVLFLDARDEVLLRRLSEATHPHPAAGAGSLPAAVAAEREVLGSLRSIADVVIDTSDLSPEDLGRRVVEAVEPPSSPDGSAAMVCTVSSFGFKYGPPVEADWVVDARFLRNPFWEPELRPLTGLDRAVHDFVWDQPAAREFVERLSALLTWTLERAADAGRSRLHLAVGCTGGRHRSVVLASAIAARLGEEGIPVVLRHRDVERPDPR
ncbi:MAG TPA: RNase adapter RapZ [Candidatus Angelobacter sp.]|nr:RNase adapter RapZ [Candidatus Angelobacter sp.]